MLLTACDDKYLSEAEFLIKSCARHELDQRFYLYLVSANSEIESLIRTWHPNIIIDRVVWPYEVGPRPGLLYCIRSIALCKALESYCEPTVYLDSDTLLRGRLNELFEALKSFDLMVTLRPQLNHVGAAGTPYGSTFNSGVIAVRPSTVGMRFAQAYDANLHKFIVSGRSLTVYRKDLKLKFVIDQELLYVTYLDMRDELLFQPLPDKFNDTRFSPDSAIWHGKGTARTAPEYVKEKLRYKNRLLYYPFSVYAKLRMGLRPLRRRLIK